jgi:hypothetical protein
MAQTKRKRSVLKGNHKTRYVMKGCSRNHRRKTKCPKCNKIHKKQGGGCATCAGGAQTGGNSVGFFQNFTNIGSNFLSGFTGIYNGLNALPQPISSEPWQGHFRGSKY